MKKKIISRKQFFINSNNFKRNITKNKKVQKLANSLMIESDKENWAYQHTWMNEPMLQTPEDIIKFQEMIFEYKPKVLIEVGIAWGGLLLFLDSIREKARIKKIIGIDIFIPNSLRSRLNKKISKKVKIFNSSSTDNKLISKLKKLIKNQRCLVHLDSNHTEKHVFNELICYDKILKKGDLIIVGDTIINYIPNQKHRVREWSNEKNPKTALDKFLKINKKYKIVKHLSNNLLLSNNYLGHIIKFKN
jgi:cephalosporin hydroxylase